MSYENYYPNGWQSGESGGTPITPEALNHMEKGIKAVYTSFAPAVESEAHPGCYYRTVNGVVEWLNPPMVPGVEYRTTERHNGKSVYVQMRSLGSMPANGEASLTIASSSGGTAITGVVGVDYKFYNSNGKDLYWSSVPNLTVSRINYANTYLWTKFTSTADLSHITCESVTRYTKD